MVQSVARASAWTPPTDSLGCRLSELHFDQAVGAGEMIFRRKTALGLHDSDVETDPEDRGLLVGLSLKNGHRRRSFEGQRYHNKIFDSGDIYIRDFDASYAAKFDGYFDFFLIELSSCFLQNAEAYTGGRQVPELERIHSRRDETLEGLARSLLPALMEPGAADPFFLDQMQTVIGIHLLRQYGWDARARMRRDTRFAPVEIHRAQEMMMGAEDEAITIAAIADEVNMPRSQFFDAFRAATGTTPYQWLLKQRIDTACALLRGSDLALAEIALRCGFADQSHFTRQFRRSVGETPGRWRKRAR